MNRPALVESPLPVLLLLGLLFGSVGYLDWMVAARTNRFEIIQVPRTPPIIEDDEGGPDEEQAADIMVGSPVTGRVVGPLHAEARELARNGRHDRALLTLDRSLATERGRDAARLEERGILLLRLDRPAEALRSLQEALDLGSASAGLHYHLGLALARTGDRVGAEAAYRRTLEINPGFDEAWNNLGLLLAGRGQTEEALAALRRAVDLAPTSGRQRPLTNLALLLKDLGLEDEARARLEAAVSLAPADPAPRLYLANLLANRPGEQEKARELYRGVIRLAPGNASGHFGLGRLESLAGDRGRAEREYRAALEIDPGHRQARLNLGMLLIDDGRPLEAERELDRLIDGTPDAKACFALARARGMRGDLAGAESAYRQAIGAAGGDYPEALYNLALLLRQQDRTVEAEEAYREAVRLDPDYAIAWFNLAMLLRETDRLEESLTAVDAALVADGDYVKAWFLRGDLISGNQPEAALSAYERAYRLDPTYGKATLNAAVLHARAGRHVEAIDLYRRVLVLDPRNAGAWFNLGLALRRLGRDQEAIEAYEAALRADPGHSGSAKNLGVLYVEEGRIEEASRILADAVQRDPDDVGLRYNLARQLERLGRSSEAFEEMKRVVQLEPRRKSAWRDLRRIGIAAGREDEVDLLAQRLHPAPRSRDRNR